MQGVGFRPFVYREAVRLGLAGSVRNETGRVLIEVSGETARLEDFQRRLVDAAPAIARPRLLSVESLPASAAADGFSILASDADTDADIHVPPDFFACGDCLAELFDPVDRRFGYPFVNCTQCGPRYTIIRDLPYDRASTSMSAFPLCAACSAEYADPRDRRFHAEPLACPDCGPRLWFESSTRTGSGNEALAAAVELLAADGIVAVRGIGGYHLLCDPRSAAAVAELRRRKGRPHKPLALMAPEQGSDGLDAVRELTRPDEGESSLLRSPMRPIVLLEARDDAEVVAGVAPGLRELGVMLPYSPLHHLLMARFGRPLVATSGNLSGEPVLTGIEQAQQRLGAVADGFLHHDRPIVRPADDAVYRRIGGVPRPLRLGRGAAPLEIELPLRLRRPVLATGSHMKNAVALAWERRLVLSPHVGDLDSRRSLEVFAAVAEDLQRLYGVAAEVVLCDAHPGYGGRRWAIESGKEIAEVHHHHAHASATAVERRQQGPWLVFTWDGVGLGPDGTLWGGEALYGAPGSWKRLAALRRFRLPGGESASREPWRSAFGLLWSAGRARVTDARSRNLGRACERGLNSPWTSAAGRLFDAFAALAGVIETTSFEGQAPMLLEQVHAPTTAAAEPLPLVEREGLLVADWEPLIDLAESSLPLSEKSAILHRVLAETIAATADRCRRAGAVETVALCGGVFQNRRLTEAAVSALEARGFGVLVPTAVPVNDAAIAVGQVVEFAARRDRERNR